MALFICEAPAQGLYFDMYRTRSFRIISIELIRAHALLDKNERNKPKTLPNEESDFLCFDHPYQIQDPHPMVFYTYELIFLF